MPTIVAQQLMDTIYKYILYCVWLFSDQKLKTNFQFTKHYCYYKASRNSINKIYSTELIAITALQSSECVKMRRCLTAYILIIGLSTDFGLERNVFISPSVSIDVHFFSP